MIRKTLYIFVLCLFGCKNIEYYSHYKLNNNPKKLTIVNYDIKYNSDSTYSKTKSGVSYYEFDSKGRMKNDYEINPTKENKNIYKYDDKGNLIEVSNYNSDSVLALSFKSYYDRKNRIFKKEVIYPNSKKITEYEYDGKNKTFIKEYNSDSLLTDITESILNKKGEIIESIYMNNEGETRSKRKFNYDNYGNQIKSSLYRKDNTLKDYSLFFYDKYNKFFQKFTYLVKIQ